MRVLNRLDISGSFGLGSTAQDQFVIGSPDLENNDISTDNLKVWANADFKNNVTLGSNSTDIIDISGTLINHGGASLTGSFSGSGQNLNNIPNTGLQNYQINLNGSNLALGATGSVGTLREITGGSNITIGLVNATTRSVLLNDNINLSSVTASFSGNGSQINNLTASNINNFSADTRKQISGTGVISYDPVTGIITYTGAGGDIYTSGNITGSGTALNPIKTKDDVSFTNVTSSNFTGSSAKLDYLDFVGLSTAPAQDTATVWQDATTYELRQWTEVPDVHIKLGQQVVTRVHNNTGVTISKGTVVHLTGSNNQPVPRINPANWADDYLSANTLGVTNNDILHGGEGYVVISGLIEGINTNGFNSGDVLYLSGSGGISNVKAVAPNHLVIVGQVIRNGNSSVGSIFVKVQNGYEIDELHNVLIASSASYDLLMLDTDGLWKNKKTLAGNYTFSGNNQFTGSLNGTASYASNADLFDGQDSSLFALKTDVTGALSPYLLSSTAASTYTTPTQVSGAISGSDRPTRTEITGVLGSYLTTATAASTYATLTGVTSSFTTPTQVSGAISGSDRPTRAEVTGALGSYLLSSTAASTYATITNVSSSFGLKTDISSSFARLAAASNTFTGPITASNISGVNTGDETQTTIKTKLGAAATAADGYLTSTDWNTFNGKQQALTLVTASTTGSATLSAGTLTIPTYIKFIPPLDSNEIFRGATYFNNTTTVTTYGGITMGATAGSPAAQVVASTNVQTKQMRLRIAASVVSTGRYQGVRGAAALWYIGGGFRYVAGIGISDTAYGSGCRQFYGLATGSADLTYNDTVTVASLVNIIGFGSDAADTNMQFFYNDAAGTATKYDLGANFPANRTAGAALTNFYNFEIYNIPGDTTNIYFRCTNLENNTVVEDLVSTNIPAGTAALNFFASRCMGGPITNTGQFDISKIGIYNP